MFSNFLNNAESLLEQFDSKAEPDPKITIYPYFQVATVAEEVEKNQIESLKQKYKSHLEPEDVDVHTAEVLAVSKFSLIDLNRMTNTCISRPAGCRERPRLHCHHVHLTLPLHNCLILRLRSLPFPLPSDGYLLNLLGWVKPLLMLNCLHF